MAFNTPSNTAPNSNTALVLADTTTVSAVLVPLLTVSITTTSTQDLLIHAGATTSNAGVGASNNFAVTLDGEVIPQNNQNFGYGTQGAGNQVSGGVTVRKAAVAAGVHTATLSWSTVGGAAAQCRPLTNFPEGAFLTLMELH